MRPAAIGTSQLANRVNRIGIVHENKPAHDSIKLLVKVHNGRVAFEKFHIAHPLILSTGYRPFDSRHFAIDTNHFATRATEFCG